MLFWVWVERMCKVIRSLFVCSVRGKLAQFMYGINTKQQITPTRELWNPYEKEKGVS